MGERENFELSYRKIEKYDDQISDLLIDIKNESKEKYWKIIRIHWIKNRHILDTFYKKKIFKKKFIYQFHLKNKLDLNLINLWCKKKFRNLCSTKVIIDSGKKFEASFCRISLMKKNINTFFLVQDTSGCVCCVKSLNLSLPLWWDQIDKIIKICKNIKKKPLFFFSFFYNHSTENFLEKNNWLVLKNHRFFCTFFGLKRSTFRFDWVVFKIFILNFIKKKKKKKINFKIFNWKIKFFD